MVNFTPARTSLALALLVAGCAVQPANAPTATPNDPLGLGDVVAPRYRALAGMVTPVAIANVSTSSEVPGVNLNASSDRNPQFFAIANLTDGNLHSAWGPAADDAAPSITLNLADATRVTGLGIKMDAGASFDVAVSNGGTFSTVATNVTSTARALDFIHFTASPATQVRLTFHVQQNAQLLVCEVKLFTEGVVVSPSPGAQQCLSVKVAGDVSVEGTIPPVFNVGITASQSATGAFGRALISSDVAADFMSGVVTSIARDGDTLTMAGSGTEFSNFGPNPTDFIVTAKATGTQGLSFTGTITGISFNGQDQFFGAKVTQSTPVRGSLADCAPSALTCISSSGESVFFDSISGPMFDVKLTDFVHSGTKTSGSVTLTDIAHGNATSTGKITAVSTAGNVLTLGGTLTNGGTFTVEFRFTAAENGAFSAAVIGVKEVDASGKTLIERNGPLQGNQGTGAQFTLTCQ